MEDKNILELRRQFAHICFGVIILWAIHFDLLGTSTLLFILILLFLLLYLIKRGVRVYLLYPILTFFERKKHLEKYPGRGLFFFLLGVMLTQIFFPNKQILIASISVLVVGDAVTNLAGRNFGKIKNPLNTKKTVEGTLAGILFSFLVLTLFYSWPIALQSAVIAMIVEIPNIKILGFPVDDNLLIPLMTAAYLSFVV